MPVTVVGEAWGVEEAKVQRPFIGASGNLLRRVLRKNGIRNAKLTNVFNLRPPRNDILTLCGPRAQGVEGYPELTKGKYVRKEFAPELDRLFSELEGTVLALGNTALWALTGQTGIRGFRGTPLRTTNGLPLLATWHPAAVLRQWNLLPVFDADVQKAKNWEPPWEATVHVPETRADLHECRALLAAVKETACDIETKNYLVTEVGFSLSKSEAVVFPICYQDLRTYWEDPADEKLVWSIISEVLQEKRIYGQNFNYDMQYLWKQFGIGAPGFAGDTMLMHHTLYPELPKSLEFLGSLYTNFPRWKTMRKDEKEIDTT